MLVWLLPQHLSMLQFQINECMPNFLLVFVQDYAKDIVPLTSHMTQTHQHKKQTYIINMFGNHSLAHMKVKDCGILWWISRPRIIHLKDIFCSSLSYIIFSTKLLKELQNFKVEEFNFKALHQLWNVCIVALQRSTFPFKAYIRPKDLEFEDTIDKHGYNGTI